MSDDNKETNVDIPIRQQLVNTAVNFLLNPDVQKRNNDSKTAFLKKKGLTDSEIAAAFNQAKFDQNVTQPFAPQEESLQIPIPPPYQPYSFWSRLSGISSSLIVFGVALYGLHYFYKEYIKPLILGEESESDTLTKSIRELSNNMIILTDNVEKLQASIVKQNEDVSKIVQLEGYEPTPKIIEDLKIEVSSLKSILISRHQFPSLPQVQPTKVSIPSWQLPSCQNNKMYTESDDKTNHSIPDESQSVVEMSEVLHETTIQNDCEESSILNNNNEITTDQLDTKPNNID